MRPLIIFLLVNYLIVAYYSVSAQSSEYTIQSFQDEYMELQDYESISLIFDGNPIWEHEFQLDFPFPFFGESYNSMIYNFEAWGMLTDDEDEALFLMNYASYEYDDNSVPPSDVRFSHVFIDNMQAFVLQFTRVGFFADPFADSLNTFMNFQLWFFENGVCEVHFGEMHMDGTPIYEPGKGFYCYSTSGGVDTTEVCGPHVGISNPFDESDAIAVSGSYNNFAVVDNIYADLTVLPPQGWIIRFTPKSVATLDPKAGYQLLLISPNPTNTYIHLPDINSKVIVFDGTGRIIYKGLQEGSILDVSFLPSGIYYAQIILNEKILIGKFTKQ